MIFEEALEILYKGIAPNPTANNECMKLCKKALEKQIPKKVELYTNDGNFKWKNYPCPCCKEMLGLNVNKRYVKFCPNCGQALDWNDTNGRK